MKLFRVVRSPETRVDTMDDLLGMGVQFPCGRCYVDWNRDAYPEENRLDHPHISDYGSLSDVEQGTGGNVEVFREVEDGGA